MQPNSLTSSYPSSYPLSYHATPLGFQVIHPEHVPWLVPPRLVPSAKEMGSWEKWELVDTEEIGTHWIYRGDSYRIEAEHHWYDRANKRRLYFEDFPDLTGVLQPAIFGIPVHRFPFYHPGDGRKLLARKVSSWMYEKEWAAKSDSWSKMVEPTAEDLPLLPRL
ncbi:hypothetical protein FB45DRAFT_1091334 [Roridomyces roridus]|uniref:Uncharacterized protein n=1 Tax=Roridomyces roridus TaxID=1738132 RepID=A0AAD7BIZ5_9AGAR|nr:hypothetical protein FB45DRAFT_1091334 [Roridomyces roridus]